MKKTKIICSIGPASYDKDVMEQMVLAGMNVARINFSHATLEEKQGVVSSVKEVRKRTGMNIAILYDTKGPEFRCGTIVDEGANLIDGNTIRIVKNDVTGNDERISVNHPAVIDDLSVGNIILLENGLMKFEVISKEEDGITCKIINGGLLFSKKSLSVPGNKLNIPFISDIDREDLVYACHNEGDFVALSFVNTKDDVLEAREIFEKENRDDMMVISKIESKTGVDNLDEILEVSDGIMVARGDLPNEVPLESLPFYQKLIIRKCREAGKVCITATEMLESMKKNARPTRAEVSDIANAVIDGTDAVMLSGETTTGKFPVETVTFMADICNSTEKYLDYNNQIKPKNSSNRAIIASSAVNAANISDAKAILISSMHGNAVREISSFRAKAIILASLPNEKEAFKLALNFGVYTSVLPIVDSNVEIEAKLIEEAKNKLHLKSLDKVILTGSFPINKQTNYMKIDEI